MASSSRVFVGRERELGRLTAAVADAVAGVGRLFLIGGEPGIGKTRLADQAARHGADSGARVLWGNCWEGDGAPPYWPWVQIVRAYARDCDRVALVSQLGEGASDIAQILPELRVALPKAPPAALALRDSEEARFRLFDAMAGFLKRASASTPMVLVIDDLQWADQSSLLLLQFIAGALRDSHLLVVCAYRDVEARRTERVNDALAALARHAQQVTLGGLSLGEVNLLIEDAFAQGPDAAAVAAVHQRTHGNPFFVDEVMRLLSAEGQLASPTAGTLARFGVPEGVREVIRRRLALVSEECRELLNVASVLGRDFDVAPLQQIVQASASAVLQRLSEARAIGVIVEGRANLARFSFSHDLVREALYEGIGYERRLALHRTIADTLERLYGDHPEAHLSELANHFFVSALGGEVDKAISYCARACDHATGQLAYERAVEQYERAIEALGLKGEPDQKLQCELLLKLGEARWSSAAFDKGEACLEAGKIAEKIGAAPELARAALGFAGPYPVFEAGIVDEVLVGLLERALALLGEGDSVATAKVTARLAAALTFSNQQQRKASLARDAVDMARRLGDKSTLAYVLIMTHWATWSPDNLDERLAVTAEVIRLGEEAGEGRVAAEGYTWRIPHCLERGSVEEADHAQQALEQLTERLRQPFPRFVAAVARATRVLMEGRVDEAEALARHALSLGQQAENQTARQTFAGQLMYIRREQGRLQEVVGSVEGLVDSYPIFPIWRTVLAITYAELGREREARRELAGLAVNDFADFPRDIFWLFGVTFLSEVTASVGDVPRAAMLYRLLLPYVDRCVTGNVVNCGGSILLSALCRPDFPAI